ncbi:MAG TPA: helix-turn-helix transcriptional regulator [Thermoanaerobaculia bacterium]|nr:helix-turn-helix transcriptional regulator [Thermoanaerobaculia bacterium]
MPPAAPRHAPQSPAELARRAEALLPLRPADLHVLLVLSDGPLHSYGISKAADSVAGRVALELGSLYRTLNRLRTEGLIEPVAKIERGPQGQERRTWRLTALGRAVARAEAERLREVVEAARTRKLLRDPMS